MRPSLCTVEVTVASCPCCDGLITELLQCINVVLDYYYNQFPGNKLNSKLNYKTAIYLHYHRHTKMTAHKDHILAHH